MITDSLPDPIRVVVVAATGLLRGEIAAAFDPDFDVTAVADARAAEEATVLGPHVLIVVADDLFNTRPEDLVHRVRIASRSPYRVAVMFLTAHSGDVDLLAAYHAGADDIGRWPLEADMFRARVRSMARVSALEASIGSVARTGLADLADLQEALSQTIHLVNNAVAGISGRAQLAALTRATDDGGLIPVCLCESRRMTLVLAALHGLSESMAATDEEAHREVVGAGIP